MTDPHDLDDLASAHLDGVTSPEEAARVAADPALLARVAELRAVRAAVGEVPAVDPVRRDVAIAAALAAFDEDRAGDHAVTPVTPLAPGRRLSPTTIRVLSAAAVVAILALLVPLLGGIDAGDDDDASFEATGDAIEGDSRASTDDVEVAEESGSPTTVLSTAAPDADLGTYEDLEALADAVTAGQVDNQAFVPQNDQLDGAAQLCTPAPAASTQTGTAVVAGEAVVVWIGVTPEGRRLLTVLRADGCEVLDEREL